MEEKRNTKLSTKGMAMVSATYAMWGLLPLFWNLLHKVNSLYILCARIIWSLVFCLCYLIGKKQTDVLKEVWRDKAMVKRCLTAGIVVCINWGIYIWAVNHGHLIDSSFGYYLNPLLSVMIGILLFKERLNRTGWLAIAAATAGVLFLIIRSGTVPVLALVIGGSFAVYGAIKKGVNLPSEISLFMETLLVTPIALPVMLYMEAKGMGSIGTLHGAEFLLLPLAGIITAIPLLLFAAGVRKIPYSVTGILMYMNPTLQLLIGVFVYQEVISTEKWIALICIWVGVVGMLISERKKG